MKNPKYLVLAAFFCVSLLSLSALASASLLPHGSLVMTNFQVAAGGGQFSLAEWNWPETWLSTTLVGNNKASATVEAKAAVDPFTAVDASKLIKNPDDSFVLDPNVEAVVSNQYGIATAKASYPSFILSNDIQALSEDAEYLLAEARMANILEGGSSDVELTLSFAYAWLFEDAPSGSDMDILGGITITSLDNDSEAFSLTVSNDEEAGLPKAWKSAVVSGSFLMEADTVYEFAIWGRTAWAAEGEGVLPSPPTPTDPPIADHPVPEPGTVFLFGMGGLFFLICGLKRNR